MNKFSFISIMAMFAIIGCDSGEVGPAGVNGVDGSGCTTFDNGNGTHTIACDDGTSTIVRDGEEGPQGPPGPAGTVSGGAGGSGTGGTGGTVSTGGSATGGTDLQACTVEEVAQGVILECGDTSGLVAHGDPGPQGVQGTVGPAGPVGPVGPQGPAGVDGSDGSDGAPGAVGATGPQGPKGDKGDTGLRGLQGVPGADGADGVGFNNTTYVAKIGVVPAASNPLSPSLAQSLLCDSGDVLLHGSCSFTYQNVHQDILVSNFVWQSNTPTGWTCTGTGNGIPVEMIVTIVCIDL
jgi:hypothetical protein